MDLGADIHRSFRAALHTYLDLHRCSICYRWAFVGCSLDVRLIIRVVFPHLHLARNIDKMLFDHTRINTLKKAAAVLALEMLLLLLLLPVLLLISIDVH